MRTILVSCATFFLTLSPAPGDNMVPGLLVTEYPRHPDQSDAAHVEIPIDQFGEAIGRPYVVHSITPWRHETERNAIARGFLRIDADGDYAFTTNSFYDRNLLMIDGRMVCGYIDGGDQVETVPLKKGLVEIASAGFVLGRGASGIQVRWRPPGQRELTAIPADRLMHRSGNDVLADWLTVVTKDFVIDAYHNGERIAEDRRTLLLDRFGASVERIDVTVQRGDWLVFHVAHNRLRHGGTKFFAVAGCIDSGTIGFASDPDSQAWSVCDDPSAAREFIAAADTADLRDSASGVEQVARRIEKPWEEGMKFMRQYAGADFPGEPLWGGEASTWIKFTAPEAPVPELVVTGPSQVEDGIPSEAGPAAVPEAVAPPHLPILAPKRWPVQILSAIYGSGGKNADVTARVKQLVEVDRKFFAANPGHLGADPNPYWNKSLHIIYYKDGIRREQRRNENEHILPESFYGPQDVAELARWLVGTRWIGPGGEVQFQPDGVLTGPGIGPDAAWKTIDKNWVRLARADEDSTAFVFDYVWRSFHDPMVSDSVHRIQD